MLSPIYSVLLLANLAAPIFGLSCYGYSAYSSHQGVVHNKTFCTAFYEVANGQGTFSGADRDPLKMEKLTWDFNQGKDCQMQKHRMHEEEEYQIVYTCMCFTSMCNFPFSYTEFKQRGYTLAPQITKVTLNDSNQSIRTH